MPRGVYKRTENMRRNIGIASSLRHPTTETKKKISDSEKGKKLSVEQKIKIGNSNRGKRRTEEQKKQISLARIGKPLVRNWNPRYGSDNNKWKGGITPENLKTRHSLEYAYWRKSLFIRDNFTCQKCGQTGGILRAHHINNFADFPELRMITDNGITLCNTCHLEFHRYFGTKNNTREQLSEFLINKV